MSTLAQSLGNNTNPGVMANKLAPGPNPVYRTQSSSASPAPAQTTPQNQITSPTPTPMPTGIYSAEQVAAQQAAAADAQRKAQAVDFINKAYDVKQAGFQDQLNTLDPMESAANLQIANQYTNRSNDLQSGLATGQRNLNYATDQVQTSKARSLDDLSRQIQQMHMGYNSQLGAMGAGDSSAAGLINQALSGQASRNRGDVLQNSSGQLTQIGMQKDDLQNSFDSQRKALDDWKQSTLSDLMTNFAQQRAQLRSAMSDADLNRQQQLAQYDTSLTQAVMDRLSQIESQSHQAAQDLQQRYMSAFAPQSINIAPELQQYAVQAIDPGKIAQMSMPQQANGNDGSTAVLLKRLQDEQNNLGA
jgi:hypothetical protein